MFITLALLVASVGGTALLTPPAIQTVNNNVVVVANGLLVQSPTNASDTIDVVAMAATIQTQAAALTAVNGVVATLQATVVQLQGVLAELRQNVCFLGHCI